MATTWFPPTGDALAILIALVGVGLTVAVARFFASTSLTVYYDGLNPETATLGPWDDIELLDYRRGLLDQSQPSRYAFALTLVNTGWFGIKTEKPIRVQFRHPQPLQVVQERLMDIGPNLELLGHFGSGELALNFDVLKRGEAVKVLIGSNHPIRPEEVALRLDDEANLPRAIEPGIRAGYLPLHGARIIGAFDLLYAATLVGSMYFGAWLIVEVIPAWASLSWLTPVRVIGDLFIFSMILGAGAIMINEMRHGAYALITGRYLPGVSAIAMQVSARSRLASVPGRDT